VRPEMIHIQNEKGQGRGIAWLRPYRQVSPNKPDLKHSVNVAEKEAVVPWYPGSSCSLSAQMV